MSCAKCYRVIVSVCIVCTLYSVASAVFHCGEWSPWYNSSTPAMYNGSKEIEEVPAEVIRVCKNGRTIRCRDNKGEPFHEKINMTSGDKKYVYSCSSDFGVTCFTTMPNASCNDYAVQFYCDCPPTPDATTITMVSSDMTSLNKDMPTESASVLLLEVTRRTKTIWFPGIENESSSQNAFNVSGNDRTGHNSGNNSIISTVLVLLLPILSWLRDAFFC